MIKSCGTVHYGGTHFAFGILLLLSLRLWYISPDNIYIEFTIKHASLRNEPSVVVIVVSFVMYFYCHLYLYQ